MIRPVYALAVSLSGSEHIVTGGVRDRESYDWQSEAEARQHLERIGWTGIRFAIDVRELSETLIISWDDQSKTEHQPESGRFTYLRGGPQSGRKISKSEAHEGK